MRPTKQFVRRSFSTHLSIAFVILVVITSLAVGSPAYWVISKELDEQAWARIDDAEHVVRVSLDAERARLENIALLASQRPSLKQLIRSGDITALSDYLKTFHVDLVLDAIAVYDTSGQLLIQDGSFIFESTVSALTTSELSKVSGENAALALIAGQPIYDNLSEDLLGYVAVGIRLDNRFFRQLATETGFDQSILVDGIRIASSLDHVSPMMAGWHGIDLALQTQAAVKTEQEIGGKHYYSTLIPLYYSPNQSLAALEVVMPIDNLLTAQKRALFALALSAFIVSLLGALLGSFYAKRLSSPLRQLTAAAHKIGQDDSPVTMPVSAKITEVATFALVLDETRIKIHRTLQELSQAKKWSETLIQSIAEGVITFDSEGDITFFSRGAEQITGWTSHEAQAQPIGTVLNLSDNETAQLVSVPGHKREIQITTRDSQRKTLEVTVANLIPPESDTVQSVLVLRDITAQETGRRLHSYFLGNITHEFHTPISGLKASIELLLEEIDYLSPAEIHELLNSIHLSVSGLQALVNNLLESVNIEAGRFSIQRRTIDLNQIVADAVRMVQPLLDRRQQLLSLTEPLQHPPVQADRTRLTQVLVNLLANASKYSPPETAIDLEIKDAENMLCISVADRGKGIPEKERANLFNRFVRLSGSTTEQYGIGLGLSVVKAIVEGHGGTVGVDERSGGGTVFWFTLPHKGANTP